MRRERGGAFGKLIALLFVFLICAAMYMLRGPLLRLAGETWVLDDPLQKADAIIVLGDDYYADRSTRAAQLYRQDMAPIVVASGQQVRPGASLSDLMGHDLFERGVPKDKIVRFPQSAESTIGQAQALEKFTEVKKWRSVILVTSNYDARRARYIFRRVFPKRIAIAVTGAEDAEFDAAHWYEKRNSIKKFILEVGGYVVAVWELRGQRDRHAVAQLLVEEGTGNLRSVV